MDCKGYSAVRQRPYSLRRKCQSHQNQSSLTKQFLQPRKSSHAKGTPKIFSSTDISTTAESPKKQEQSQQTLTEEISQNGSFIENGIGEQIQKSQAYPFTEIEQKWQKFWRENKTFRTPEKVDTSKPKYYVLDMFPYPSGAGLHVGHPEGYTATDIMARFKRLKGFNVLHPMGWDAFGLPAEQYAIQTGTHPKITTDKNINRFREQLQSLGFSYDWDREISTTDPNYYKWTQWIFIKLLEKGLAYQAEVPVNWCPELGTVLANEEVIDGKSERGGFPVVRMPMKQWMLKITAYADRLLQDLDQLDWDENIKEMQRNWIGRSEGANILFQVQTESGENSTLEVYTTRPDTIFGVSYMVVAPEHPQLANFTSTENKQKVEKYVEAASRKSDMERTGLQKGKKTGIFTGSYALNPANGQRVPIWVADYVLGSYGFGAVMAVPGHDDRDFEFAMTYDLPIKQVVCSGDPSSSELCYVGEGKAINSASSFSGLDLNNVPTSQAQQKVIEWLQEKGIGEKKVNYKLRDWLFARQRYWGEPFPVIYVEGDETTPTPISPSDLPLTLPDTDNFKPSGTPESPLANISSWVNLTDSKTGKPARRETSTMPQWAGSCWYYLRYIDPTNNNALIDKDLEKYWMPVDMYVGGTEHAVLHLLYARFWHKFLYDIGVVSTKEPFQRLVSQGMILGETEYTVHQNGEGEYVGEDDEGAVAVRVLDSEVEKKGDSFVLKSNQEVRVSARAFKMSKSRGNVVNPDDVVYQYGADSLRLYEMFMGPLRETKVWSTRSVEGVHRFLSRTYRLFTEIPQTDEQPTKQQLQALHKTILKVTIETEELRFNTAIAAMMEFINTAIKWENQPKLILKDFCLLLSPYAPHLAEELWQMLLGGKCMDTIAYEAWPVADEKLLVADVVKMVVQVNGKVRGTLEVDPKVDKDTAIDLANQIENVKKFVDGKEVKKTIFVPGKIVNIVVGK